MPDMSGFGSSKDVRSCECKTSLLEMRGTSLSLSTCRGIVHSLVTPWTRSAESLYVILSLLEPEEASDQGADHCFPTFITNQALSLEDYLGGRQVKRKPVWTRLIGFVSFVHVEGKDAHCTWDGSPP